MAAISLYNKYKFSFLHPQMSSIWAEYALHVPPDAWRIGLLLFIGVPCMWKGC